MTKGPRAGVGVLGVCLQRPFWSGLRGKEAASDTRWEPPARKEEDPGLSG